MTCAIDPNAAADIVFVFDDTASMGLEIESMQQLVGDVAQKIFSTGSNVRYGLVSFSDVPEIDMP